MDPEQKYPPTPGAPPQAGSDKGRDKDRSWDRDGFWPSPLWRPYPLHHRPPVGPVPCVQCSLPRHGRLLLCPGRRTARLRFAHFGTFWPCMQNEGCRLAGGSSRRRGHAGSDSTQQQTRLPWYGIPFPERRIRNRTFVTLTLTARCAPHCAYRWEGLRCG